MNLKQYWATLIGLEGWHSMTLKLCQIYAELENKLYKSCRCITCNKTKINRYNIQVQVKVLKLRNSN